MFIPIVVVVLIIGYLWYSGSQQLFCISVRGGKLSVVRGYVPPGLLVDFGAALKNVERGEVRAHKAANGARLSFGGRIDEGVAQRLRNIFGLYPIARLRAPEVDKRQLVSDAFTLSWLVSLVRSFFRW